MEPIQTALKKWMRDSTNFQEHYQNMRQAILNDPDVQEVIRQHPDLSSQDLERHLIKLYEYQSQSKNCDQCPSLNECKNLVPGYTPTLYVVNKDLRLTYEMCPKKIQAEEQRQKHSFINSLYMPKEILNATFNNLDLDNERYEAIRLANNYIEYLGTEKAAKGLYFYGPFGVGKTYLLGAIANDLAKEGISSFLIYMPEFVREMKSSIQDQSINEKIERFKTAPVLMLDDIGAESISPWFRDEILGSILQYRMMERLPVFFTSNYSLDELQDHLSTTNKGNVEKLKAGRIIERMKQVSHPVALNGQSRRN